jgi:signal transduction histidine kinase
MAHPTAMQRDERLIDFPSFKSAALVATSTVLLAAAYYVAARAGLGFRFQNSLIGVVWPAHALLLSALVLTPPARWWLVLVTTGVAHAAALGDAVPGWRIVWQILGNGAFALATVEALRRFAGLPLRFDSRRQVIAFTAISFIMPAVFGLTTPAFVLSAFNLEPAYSPLAALQRTVLANATATLLLAPVVLLWLQYGVGRLSELSERRLGEAAAVMLALLAVAIITFSTGPEVGRFPSLPLLVFPPLLWAAVRFGPLGASTSLFFVAALSIWGTARQFGPFVLGADTDQVLALQLFWIVLCPPVMLLAAVIREHEQAEGALQDQRNQLAHVTRVATVGELSGALAHELRQPLTSILSNAQTGLRLLAQHPVDLQELREILEDITQQDQQAAGVISGVRSFLQEGDSTFEPLAVDGVVRDALKLGRSTIEVSGVAVHAQIPPDLPGVRGDRVQLLQVVLNLIVNGCESMSAMPAPNRRLQLVASRADEAHVEVVVRDRGVGLPYGREGRVFEPFFTTKPKGLGLGLAIGRSIAAAHGGRLWGENNPHGGATFRLVLPTATRPAGASSALSSESN